jgi:hypothetical protein
MMMTTRKFSIVMKRITRTRITLIHGITAYVLVLICLVVGVEQLLEAKAGVNAAGVATKCPSIILP